MWDHLDKIGDNLSILALIDLAISAGVAIVTRGNEVIISWRGISLAFTGLFSAKVGEIVLTVGAAFGSFSVIFTGIVLAAASGLVLFELDEVRDVLVTSGVYSEGGVLYVSVGPLYHYSAVSISGDVSSYDYGISAITWLYIFMWSATTINHPEADD